MIKIKTVSDHRAEKNLNELKSERQQQKSILELEYRIKYYQSEIMNEKTAIESCLKCEFYSMAKNKINRIIELRDKIITVQTEIGKL